MIGALMRAELRQLTRAPVALGAALTVAVTPAWLAAVEGPGEEVLRGFGAVAAVGLGSLIAGRPATPDADRFPGDAHPALPVRRGHRIAARALGGLLLLVLVQLGVRLIAGWPALGVVPAALFALPFVVAGAAGGRGTTPARLLVLGLVAALGIRLGADWDPAVSLPFAAVFTPLFARTTVVQPGAPRVIRLPGPRGLGGLLGRRVLVDVAQALVAAAVIWAAIYGTGLVFGGDPGVAARSLPALLAAGTLLLRPALPGHGTTPLPDASFRLPISRARLTGATLLVGALRATLAVGLAAALTGGSLAHTAILPVAALGALGAAGDLAASTSAPVRLLAGLALAPLMVPLPVANHLGLAAVALAGAGGLAGLSLGLGRRRTLRALG